RLNSKFRRTVALVLVMIALLLVFSPSHRVASKSAAGWQNSSTFVSLASKDQSAVPVTTESGLIISQASIDFGYQLVGTTSLPKAETVTNSSTSSIVITEFSVSGRDRSDFGTSCNCSLPLTLVPGNSVEINLTFTPAAPWRAGSRNARLEISEK